MHPFSHQNAHGMPLLGHVVVAGEGWKRIVATMWVNARLKSSQLIQRMLLQYYGF